MRGKKSTLITTLAVVFSVISLVTAFSVLGISNSIQGISIEEKKIWKLEIDNVSKLAMDEGAIEVLKEPSFDRFNVNYGIKLNRAQSVAQFEFTIKNEGNIDALVKKININGIGDYTKYITVNFFDFKEGDVIKAGSMIQVKVITNYLEQVNNELLIPQIVNLDNIDIDIELEKIE